MGSWKYSSLPWKRRCLQNGTFEEKLSFRQNSLSLGFSYGKAAEKQSWESITEERVHHTLPRRGSSVKGLAKDEKNKGPQKKRASVEALPGKRVLLCKVGCCFANCSRRKRVPSNSPWKGFLRTKDGCMRKERAPSNSPWRGSFAREKWLIFDKNDNPKVEIENLELELWWMVSTKTEPGGLTDQSARH